jgi:hypothetical protein
MGLRTLNPTTPGVRGRVAPDFSELTKGNSPLKSLTESSSSRVGGIILVASPRAFVVVDTSAIPYH